MRPYLSFFTDDLEDTPPAAPPVRWVQASNGVVCVSHRGSHWVSLPGSCAPLIVAGPLYFDRLEFDLELPSEPPSHLEFVLQVGSRFGLQVDSRDGESYRVCLSSEECEVPGPLAGPHHIEIVRLSETETRHYWDGHLVLTLATARAYGSLRAICNASGGSVLLDNIVCSQREPGGVALHHDGQIATLCGGIERRASLDPPAFTEPELGPVLRRPPCASLPSGWRFIASETDAGVGTGFARDLLPFRPTGGVTMLTGHRCPALCLRPERGEALLLTWRDDALHLTRGSLRETAIDWQPPDPDPVVGGDVAEASPALCALPDGRLLLCYQDTRSAVHALISSDDGRTWDPSSE